MNELILSKLEVAKLDTNGLVLNAETLTAAGAVSVTIPVSIFNSATATNAMTLADGTAVGQVKVLTQIHADNEHTITPVTTDGAYATIVLTTIGESVMLLWSGVGWSIISRAGGAASGAAAVAGYPVIA